MGLPKILDKVIQDSFSQDSKGNLEIIDNESLAGRQIKGRPWNASNTSSGDLIPVVLPIGVNTEILSLSPSNGFKATLDSIDITYYNDSDPVNTDKAAIMIVIDHNIDGLNPTIILGSCTNINSAFSANVQGMKINPGGSVTIYGYAIAAGNGLASITGTEEQVD